MQTIAVTPTCLHLNENCVHVSVCTRHLEMTGVCGVWLAVICMRLSVCICSSVQAPEKELLLEESYY